MARLRRDHHRMLGQRLLRPPRPPRLRLRIHLRDLHLLRHRHRVPAHTHPSTRRRRHQEPDRKSTTLQPAQRRAQQ
jgi:hypothetical protein